MGLRIRQAARAVLVDDGDRILLVRFQFPGKSFWATPGGGVEAGESHPEALRRELAEEVGLHDPQIGPELWTRLHVTPFLDGRWDGQEERFFLVRTKAFEPAPRFSWERLNAEYMFEIRWWPAGALERAETVFAPSGLPRLLRRLLEEGPPPAPFPIDV